jgi:glyoxylase-like metal-dependent hydrolase (beta-lactamase superfamily II)
MKRIHELGGVRFMFLTHRDDVADHARFRKEFGCERILHAADISGDTRHVEIQPVGDEPVRLADDLLIIPVSGHTRGSSALLYGDTFLFTGDHLWADEDTDKLHASRGVAWYSWSEQIRSIEKLLDYSFTWVLPGHERRFHVSSPALMKQAIRELLGEPSN